MKGATKKIGDPYDSLTDAQANVRGRLKSLEEAFTIPAPAEANPWRQAVDRELVASGLDCLAPDAEATPSLARLLSWRCTIALDPAVSEEAQALVERGRASAPSVQVVEPQEGLRPCPFCGSTAVMKDTSQSNVHWATCLMCKADGPICETEALAVETWNDRAAQASALPAAQQPAVEPIPMLLHCPKCGTQHVDAPEVSTKSWSNSLAGGDSISVDWTNPPHRSHLCHHCGCIWRPADVPTTGVKAIATKGKADTWDQGAAAPAVEPVAWLVHGGRLFADAVYLLEKHAQQAVERRDDGSQARPLYASPTAQPATPGEKL